MDIKANLANLLNKKRQSVCSFDDLRISIEKKFEHLAVSCVKGETLSWIVITQKIITHPGALDVQLQICSDKTFELKVLGVTKSDGKIESDNMIEDFELRTLLMQLNGGNYCFCPGIINYQDYKDEIRFDSKHVRHWISNRVDSDNCLLWHRPQKRNEESYKSLCDNCVQLTKQLKTLSKRAQDMTTPQKESFVKPSSKRGYMFMSPPSQKRRRSSQNDRRRYLKRFLKKMKQTDVELTNEQSEELLKVGKVIDKDHPEALSDIMNEASAYSEDKKATLSQIWALDVKNRADFQQDQKRNKPGGRGNKWNMITYRMALAVYVRSKSAYKALSSFQILNLPSVQSLTSFTRNKIDRPGECDTYLSEQLKKYKLMCDELRSKSSPVPEGMGALIFDEVKVVSQVLFNSKNNTLVGYAMNADDMAGLQDIYLHLDPNNKTLKTHYILQFLWRDLCSDFDVLGPYYTCHASLEHKYIIACVLDAMRKLNNYAFKTKVIICDGASSNLTAIKYFMGHRGMFDHSLVDGDIVHRITPRSYNPLTNEDMFFMICPTHQMKNIIAQLYASRPRGAKAFEKDNVSFGWTAIQEVYNEDIERIRAGNMQLVPELKLAYVVRDAWTRLNVAPSKVMCQDNLIAALRMLADEKDDMHAKSSINMTANYLSACNELFERGILSNRTIRQSNTSCMDDILKGHRFFEEWLDSLMQKPGGYKAAATHQQNFLAWQTWDLQRIMVHGFHLFCQNFISKYEDKFFICPKRLNGSAIESLFSQLKHLSGGRLSATTYQTAKAAYLTKVDIHGQHHGESNYRNVPLFLQQSDLTRK